jgi:hypothetical protein
VQILEEGGCIEPARKYLETAWKKWRNENPDRHEWNDWNKFIIHNIVGVIERYYPKKNKLVFSLKKWRSKLKLQGKSKSYWQKNR